MKKIFSILIIIGLISCSKSDDDNSKPAPDAYILEAIIGSWAYNTVEVDGIVYDYEHTEGCEKDLFQFYNEEGKEFDFEEDYVSNCDICAECAISSTNLRWELYGNKIDLYFGEQLVLVYTIIEVNATKITYQVEVDYDEDGDTDLIEITGVSYDPYGEFD